MDKPAAAHAPNLERIVRVTRAGALALMECQLKTTGEIVAVLRAVQRDGDGLLQPVRADVSDSLCSYKSTVSDGEFHRYLWRR